MIKYIIYLCLVLAGSACASGPWETGDWVNYSDFRYVTACDKGREYVYFSTTGGILQWDFYRKRWDIPLTVALLPGAQVPFDTVYCLAYDDDTGYLWCGSRRGLLVYSTMMDSWERHILPLGDPPARSIGVSGGAVWVSAAESDYGVRTYFRGDANSGAFYVVSPSDIPPGVSWRGERVHLPEKFPQYFVSAPGMIFDVKGELKGIRWDSYPVTCQSRDGRGNIWLGFFGMGPAAADEQIMRLELHPRGPDSAAVRALLYEESDVWMGGRAFTRWRRKSDKWDYYPAGQTVGFYGGRVDDIARVKKKIYIATDLGLSILDLKSGRFVNKDRSDNLWDPHVTALAAGDGVMWAGTAQGLNMMELAGNEIVRVEEEAIRGLYINDIALDEPFIWVGTDYGLYLHDRETGRWTYVRGADETAGSAVYAIQAGLKEVWVGRDLGLEMFNKDTGIWTGYPSLFFRHREARSVLAGDSLVWVGTDGGLFKFDRKLNAWTGFSSDDGLPSDTVNVIHRAGDYLWLGTQKGLCRFYWNDPYRVD